MALIREESQKENAPVSASRGLPGRKPTDPLPVPTSGGTHDASKSVNGEVSTKDTAKPSTSKTDLARESVAPAISQPSYNAPAACVPRCEDIHDVPGTKGYDKQVPPHLNNRRKRQRSVSPQAEDSFAGSLPPEIERKRYTRETKLFHVPVSQLGQTQESIIDDSDENDGMSPAAAKDMRGSMPPNEHSAPSRKLFREISVTRTSSQSQVERSQDSQSQSLDYPHSSLQAQGQEFEEDFFPPPQQPRSSFEVDDPNLVHDTQAEQSEPESVAGSLATQLTQPSTPELTQPDDDMPAALAASYHQQSGSTSTTNGPRSILALVDPRKHWRFRGNGLALAQAHANCMQTQLEEKPESSTAGLCNWEETQPSDASNLPATGQRLDQPGDGPSGQNMYEETQPSGASNLPATGLAVGVDEGYEATQPTPASNFPATGQETDPSSSMQALAPSSSRHLNESDMDVVPDSEPTQPMPPQNSAAPLPALHPDAGKHSHVEVSGETRMETRKDGKEGTANDDEDELPLAVATSSKPKSVSSKPVRQEMSDSLMLPPRKKTRMDPSLERSAVPNVASLFSEDEVIPSSDPQERLEASTKTSKATRTVRGKPKKATTLPVTPTRSRAGVSHESDLETAVSGNRAETAHDDEARTEVADDESEQLVTRPSTTRKRKRMPSSSVKGSARSIRTIVQTPPVGSARRMKSSSIMRKTSPATRVLALWKQDSHYYVGTIHSEYETSGQQYVVHFDDGEKGIVDLSKIRRCELRKGDYVMVKTEGKPLKGEVVNASRCLSNRTVEVRLDDDHEEEVSTEDLLVPSRTIISRWNDRVLTAEEIVTMIRPKNSRMSPTPSNSADINSWSESTRKLFNKTGFLVTMSPGKENWEEEKKNLEVAIKNHGGVIFEDWCHVFKMDGSQSLQGKRWIYNKEEISFTQKDVDRVFLLANDANHKPKFLIALALGIPCVNSDWLFESMAEVSFLSAYLLTSFSILVQMEEREWQQYLLPAGFSDKLSVRVTQMVDCDWGNCPEHIRDIMDNPVPSRLFADQKILCVSPDFLPVKTTRRVSGL